MLNQDFRYHAIEKHITTLVDGKALLPGEKIPSLRALSRQLCVGISGIWNQELEPGIERLDQF